MSCVLSVVCFVAYWITDRPELMIAAGLFAIAAEIIAHKNTKKEEE